MFALVGLNFSNIKLLAK